MTHETDDQIIEKPSIDNEENLDWAKQAYARLKQQQEETKIQSQILLEKTFPQESIEEPSSENSGINSLEETSNSLQEVDISRASLENLSSQVRQEEPILGEFDDTFAWSAKVLEAQGKKADKISLDEINWLSRLQQG